MPSSSVAYMSGTAYLLAHLVVYALAVRYSKALSTERGIFRYHCWSAIAFSLALLSLSATASGTLQFSVAAGLIALHGIYSMTFLEFWSLAQGSYSLQILRLVRFSLRLPLAQAVDRLSSIGENKRRDRLQGLLDLGLIEAQGERLVPTLPGRVLARALRTLLFLANYKEPG